MIEKVVVVYNYCLRSGCKNTWLISWSWSCLCRPLNKFIFCSSLLTRELRAMGTSEKTLPEWKSHRPMATRRRALHRWYYRISRRSIWCWRRHCQCRCRISRRECHEEACYTILCWIDSPPTFYWADPSHRCNLKRGSKDCFWLSSKGQVWRNWTLYTLVRSKCSLHHNIRIGLV